jgi:hypothetical protein
MASTTHLGSPNGFSFETVGRIVPNSAGFAEPNLASDAFYPVDLPSVPNAKSKAEPGPSAMSVTAHQARGEPPAQEHKYQCTTCRKVFDRINRLENCHNRHANVKPHRCFGGCGWLGWYALYPSTTLSRSMLTSHLSLAQPGMRPLRNSTGIKTGMLSVRLGKVLSFGQNRTDNSSSGKVRSKQNLARHKASCQGGK